MTEKDLLRVMGEIDDQYVEEAASLLEETLPSSEEETKSGTQDIQDAQDVPGGSHEQPGKQQGRKIRIRRLYLAGSVAAACLVFVIGAGIMLSGRFGQASKTATSPDAVQQA